MCKSVREFPFEIWIRHTMNQEEHIKDVNILDYRFLFCKQHLKDVGDGKLAAEAEFRFGKGMPRGEH